MSKEKAETQSEAEVKNRTCGNCACLWEGNQNDFYCRRNVPQAIKTRVEVPRMHNGQQVMRNGKPVMEMGEQLGLMYPPTDKSAVCFDGWRPAGTLPGDKFWDFAEMAERSMEGYKKLLFDMQNQTLASLGTATCPNCNGTGEISEGAKCEVCEGLGIVNTVAQGGKTN